jgi:FkbM family methyltransferase
MITKIIKFSKLLSKHNWRIGLLNGVAANIELKDLINNIKFSNLIDVGSNKGQFIILSSEFQNLDNIYSFEPQKDQLKIQKKLFKNNKKIKFYNFALGSKNKKLKFYFTERKDSSSLLKINKNLTNKKSYNIQYERYITVKDGYSVFKNLKFNKPVLLKIDVQGYELEVLKGFKKLLKKINFILLEVSNKNLYLNQSSIISILNYLKKKNFKKINNNKWTFINKSKNVKQMDILFKNEKLD